MSFYQPEAARTGMTWIDSARGLLNDIPSSDGCNRAVVHALIGIGYLLEGSMRQQLDILNELRHQRHR